jgi:glycosyltransferase involved in cell wall biosynthesis
MRALATQLTIWRRCQRSCIIWLLLMCWFMSATQMSSFSRSGCQRYRTLQLFLTLTHKIFHHQAATHLNATDFIFVGANHIANFAAIIWFLEEVLPQFNRSPPSIKIIGSVGEGMKIHHSAVYQAHEQLFIGEVEDISQYYMNATAVLAPMRSGRGISIKTIEAAAAGKPVIGLAHAYRGIPEQTVLDCGIEVAKNAEEFAYLMQKVLQDPAPMIAASCRLHNALFTCEQFAASMGPSCRACMRRHKTLEVAAIKSLRLCSKLTDTR